MMVDGTKITKADVLQVAEQLGLNPTEEQIQKVLDEHENACQQDPTGTWDLVVEQQLYEILNP